MPSSTARATGFMIAVVTAFLGGLTIWDGATSGGAAADVALRAVTGVLLIALAVAVGALCVAPSTVRALFRR